MLIVDENERMKVAMDEWTMLKKMIRKYMIKKTGSNMNKEEEIIMSKSIETINQKVSPPSVVLAKC